MNRSENLFSVFLLIGLLSFTFTSLAFIPSINPTPGNNSDHELIFTIPVGEKGIHYAGEGNPDVLTWGPAAFTIAPDGSFWIADSAISQLLHFSSNGTMIERINVGDFVIGAGDLEVSTQWIWILDTASIPPKIVRLALDGNLTARFDLPAGLRLVDGLSGLAIGGNGEILVERGGGVDISQFINAQGMLEPRRLDGYPFYDKIYSAHPADLKSSDRSRGEILAGGNRVNVSVTYDLGGLRFLDVLPEGDFFVIVEELVVNPALQVDLTVRRYNDSGEWLGTARFPLSSQFTYVSQGLALGSNGEVYALITRPGHAEIWRLILSDNLPPILSKPKSQTPDNVLANQGSSLLTCRSRDSMISAGEDYINNSVYLDSYHINDPSNECSGRTKPHYLSASGYYSSVPYDWGGGDAIDLFNGYMDDSGKFAGDINTASEEGCSRGVDCAGFVSNAWALGTRYGTCQLENYSCALDSTGDLLRGDIMNHCNLHTILFSDFYGSGMVGYESTTYLNYDRVVFTYRSFSSIDDYTPRRYTDVCDNECP